LYTAERWCQRVRRLPVDDRRDARGCAAERPIPVDSMSGPECMIGPVCMIMGGRGAGGWRASGLGVPHVDPELFGQLRSQLDHLSDVEDRAAEPVVPTREAERGAAQVDARQGRLGEV